MVAHLEADATRLDSWHSDHVMGPIEADSAQMENSSEFLQGVERLEKFTNWAGQRKVI